MSKDYKSWSTNADSNNKSGDLFNDTTSPAQFLGRARDLQSEIAKLRDFTYQGVQTHKLIKNVNYQALLGQVVYVELTSDANSDFTIKAPVNPQDKDTFEVVYALKGTDKYKPIVDLGNGTTQDLSTFFGIRLHFEYKAGDNPAWNMSSVGRFIYDEASWDKANEDSGFKKTADTSLGDLKNVSTTGSTAGQALVVDSSGNWKPGTVSSSSSVDLTPYTKLDGSGTFTNISTWKTKLGIPSLTGYATQNWVNSQNFLKTIPSTYALKSDIPSLSGYATQNWVNSQGFLKNVPSTYALKSDLTTYRTIATSYSKGEVDTKIAGIDAGTGWQTIINDDHSLTNEKLYWLYLTTSSTGTYNLTLPSSPSNKDTLYVILNEKNGSGKFRIKGQVNNTTDYDVKASDYKKLLKLEYFAGSNWQLTEIMDWTKTASVDVSDLAKKDASNVNVSDWQTKLKIPADTATALSGKLDNPASGYVNVVADSSDDLYKGGTQITGSSAGSIPRLDKDLNLKFKRSMLTNATTNKVYNLVVKNTNNYEFITIDDNGVIDTPQATSKDDIVSAYGSPTDAQKGKLYLSNGDRMPIPTVAEVNTALDKYTTTDNLDTAITNLNYTKNAITDVSNLAKKDASNLVTNDITKWRTKLDVDSSEEVNSKISDKLMHVPHNIPYTTYDLQQVGNITKLEAYPISLVKYSMVAKGLVNDDDDTVYANDVTHAIADKDRKLTLTLAVFVPRGYTIDLTNLKGTFIKGISTDGFVVKDKNGNFLYFRIRQKDRGQFNDVKISSFGIDGSPSVNQVTYDNAVLMNVKCTQTALHNEYGIGFDIHLLQRTGSDNIDSLPFYMYSQAGWHDADDRYINPLKVDRKYLSDQLALKLDVDLVDLTSDGEKVIKDKAKELDLQDLNNVTFTNLADNQFLGVDSTGNVTNVDKPTSSGGGGSGGGVSDPDMLSTAFIMTRRTKKSTSILSLNVWQQCAIFNQYSGIFAAQDISGSYVGRYKGSSITKHDTNTISLTAGTYQISCTGESNKSYTTSFAVKVSNSNIPTGQKIYGLTGDASSLSPVGGVVDTMLPLALKVSNTDKPRTFSHIFTVTSGAKLTFWQQLSHMTSNVGGQITITKIG